MNPPRREPGQVVTPAYLRDGALGFDAQGREIVGRDGPHFNNRPLYGEAEAEGVVLAGDRPFVRLLGNFGVAGTFAAGIVRAGAGPWFHDYASVEARYRCGRMTWRMSDPGLPGVGVELSVAPLAAGAGFAARLGASGLSPGDRLVWAFGGARREDNPRTRWDPVFRGNPQIRRFHDGPKPELLLGPLPEDCRGNEVRVGASGIRVEVPGAGAVVGTSDRGGSWRVGDASSYASPAAFADSVAGDLPAACGTIDLRAGADEAFWEFRIEPGTGGPGGPAGAFAAAVAYLESIERMRSQTPDPLLDAAVSAVCHPVDAGCERRTGIFRHGCMSFSIRLLGWRVLSGAPALGWHDRVRRGAEHYAALQVTDPRTRTEAEADPHVLLCHEGPGSRLHGRGRIPADQHMYNTQSQLFDQLLRDWRWTADPALEAELRPALELHLEWARECFDPDDDGLYESYINTLPTDSVWYNGGAGMEETAYAFFGHLAAADMARRAGDAPAETRHRERAARISRAVREVLWLPERGHYGLYVEKGGNGRVHADAWTISQFLPVDAGLSAPEEALQALHYTEWALERTRLPFGGVLCQLSNWVPSKWSVRDLFSGDQCHQALACFATGLAEEGWDLLRGSMLETCYAGAVPGGFSHIGAGTDFGDSVHMFARAVAEGLFGFDPDLPNGVVRVRPAFPAAWPRARLETPDFTLEFRREADADRYRLVLAREAAAEFRLPVRATRLRRVTVDGRDAAWRAEPGWGCTWVFVAVSRVSAGPDGTRVAIELEGRLPAEPRLEAEVAIGGAIRIGLGEPATTLRDLHGAIDGARISDGILTGTAAARPGHHLVLVGAGSAQLPRWKLIRLGVTDPLGDAARAARTPREAPPGASWDCLDLAPVLNGDVRDIFKQEYLSPRPRTCSVRLGTDGYSAWTFPHWREGPPEIGLDLLDPLASGQGRIRTPQGAVFLRPADGSNIAFTSLWDNWPRDVRVPVNRAASSAWLLVCGSTFPMQTRIANARILFRYRDGVTETLDLVPPLNFWCLCPWGGLDYDPATEAFSLPAVPPPSVQLGRNCRAMVMSWMLRPGVELSEIALETLSQDVVIGLMGVSLADPVTR